MKEEKQSEQDQIPRHFKKRLTIEDLQAELSDTSKNKKILISLFIVSLLIFMILVYFAPNLEPEERKQLFRIPRQPEDLITIDDIITKYAKTNFTYVLITFCYLYIFLQAFAIPGPVILSILSGTLFGGVFGFLLVCLCATFGASACYGLSYTLGRGLVLSYFPQKLLSMKQKVKDNKEHLFWYMLFLRITPLVPNWFVNISSPIVGMSFTNFFFGTLLGLMPANTIHVKTGLVLHDIEKIGMNLTSIFGLILLGFLALIPTFIKKKYAKKMNLEPEITEENSKNLKKKQ